jgi:D-alanyl-lipoteichoic acid acyltransferase DltB (MBOAT superfamily)
VTLKIIIGLLVYLIASRWLLGRRSAVWNPAFALLNLSVVYVLFFRANNATLGPQSSLIFLAYVVMVCSQYLALCLWGKRSGWVPWLAVLLPIAFLIVVRSIPFMESFGRFSPRLYESFAHHPLSSTEFVGLSYLAFRTSHLVLEVRNGVVPRPDCWEYLSFAFFAPTLSVGPISPYSLHRQAFVKAGRPEIPIGRASLRVLIGAVKFRFLAPILDQLTYANLLLDGHPHLWVDLPIAALAYYLYLYCNFSGFCDIAIGSAGLMGIPVAENFMNPFAARNPKDYWNRWHITLSQYMRDMVFSPVSKALVRVFGFKRANHAIALTIFVIFLLVGIWHGTGWQYAAFGLAHGFGVAANHYYTIALKKRLGKEGFAAYNRSPAIHAAAVMLTFIFVTTCLFLFANTGDDMKRIFSALRSY